MPSHGTRRFAGFATLLAVPVLLVGCAATVPAAVSPGGVLPATGAWEGRYQGVASLMTGSAAGCERQIAISDFHVTANRVSYSDYFGMIRPNGVAVLEADGPIIEGRFEAGVFTGTVRATRDGCAYAMRVARVGP